ncbi:YraN family protein [Chromatium weissei]|nr:YraN family protein [Chromatium weissei]
MEQLAESFLVARGLQVLARNHRCRFGELDLIVRDETVLVFVEVRFRRSAEFGGAAASVNRRKQQRLIAAAQHYLQTNPLSLPCRFDVVAIRSQHDINWIQNAFILEN